MEDITFTKPSCSHFVKHCLLRGGRIVNTGWHDWAMRTDLKKEDSMFPAYCNPSIFYDEVDDQFLCAQRNVSYILNGSKGKLWGAYGPLHYIIPQERYNWLETRNYIGNSRDAMDEFCWFDIQMKEHPAQWYFRGLEDVRLVRWEGKLYAIGVRRDDNPTGRGRMEMCELDEYYHEVRSVKLKAPDGDKAYCVKNWMPVIDKPYHFIDQALNPLRIVKVNPDTGDIEYEITQPTENYLKGFDMGRGSSQCIPWENGHHLTIIHTCQMYYLGNGRKFARYLHAFVDYNPDWTVAHVSPLFSFDDFVVEFCCGMAMKDDQVYISFALQDNISYILETNINTIQEFIEEPSNWDMIEGMKKTNTIWDTTSPQSQLYSYAMDLYQKRDCCGAFTWLTKAVDLYPMAYDEYFMAARCIADLGHRDFTEIGYWMDVIEYDTRRPEGYAAAAMYYQCRGHNMEAKYWIDRAIEKMIAYKPSVWYKEDDIICARNQIYKQTSHYDEVSGDKAKKAF